MSTQGPLIARQLICTNVEADLSPTRQRGLQIWQWSPGLSVDQRRLIAQRIDNYRLPPGVVSTAADVARHVFDRGDGLTILARTVPLQEKDKFNRGGRFFAHAIVFDNPSFDATGCDPFRVFDGGFVFCEHPNQVVAANENWRKGELPDALIKPAEPCDDRTEVGRDVVLALLKHLEPPGQPIVVAEPPAGVLRLLRGLFALLPPEVRRKLTFDTLSGGAALQKIPFVVAGAYSPAALKLWSFRRYVRFEPASGQFSPKLSTAPMCLPQALLFEPGWAALSDDDRTALFDEVRKLVNLRLDDLKPDRLSQPALTVLEGFSATADALRAARHQRERTDVPAALREVPAVARAVEGQLDVPLAVLLPRLAAAVPADLIDEALFDEFGREGATRPPAALLEALIDRARGTVNPYLPGIARRWRGEFSIDSVETALAGGNDDVWGWFAEWARSTLPQELRGADAFTLIVHELEVGSVPRERLIDFKLCLGLDPLPDLDLDNEAWLRAAVLTESRANDELSAKTLSALQQARGLAPWLAGLVARSVGSNWYPGWRRDPNSLQMRLQIGLWLRCEGDAARYFGLIEILTNYPNEAKVARALFDALWPVPLAEGLNDDNRDVIGVMRSERTEKVYGALLEAKEQRLGAARAALLAHLAPPVAAEQFRATAEGAFEKLTAAGCAAKWVLDKRGDLVFAGLLVAPHGAWLTAFDYLFDAICGAAIDPYSAASKPGVPRFEQKRRFTWLVNRLAEPTRTAEGLKFPE